MYCSICQDDDHAAGDCQYYRPPGRALPAGAGQPGRLPQHVSCTGCGTLTYAWDRQACGRHLEPGTERPFAGFPASVRRVRDLAALALEQVAEARAARGDDLDRWWAQVTAPPAAAPLSPPQRT